MRRTCNTHIANIGVIDVAIHVVSDNLVAATVEIFGLRELAAAVGERAKFFQRQRIKPQRFGGIDARAVPNFLQ